MPAPYNYSIQQPEVSSYFDAFRQGKADRMAGEAETRNKQLSQYLPGALQGDEQQQQQALASASPDQQINLAGVFATKSAQELAKLKELQTEGARTAIWADSPEKWTIWNAEGRKRNPKHQDVPFEQRGMILAQAQTVAEQLGLVLKEKELALDASRTKAQNAASYASADAARASADAARRKPVGGIDPYTGARIPPPGVEGRDSGTLKEFGTSSDAAARAATTLRNVLPQLSASKDIQGPGFGGRRTVAGVLSLVPGVTDLEKMLDPKGQSQTENIIANFDAIEAASKDLGIAKLGEIGGSDTERELLTAIQTTVSPNKLAVENARIYRNQLAAADILAQKADLATKWTNKFGSLKYGAPSGETWNGFWAKYQKVAWADHRRTGDGQGRAAQPAAPTGRPASTQSSLPPPPPGFEIVE